MRRWVWLAGGLVGCRGDEAPGWAVLHGSIRETAGGVEGQLVWELFTEEWGRKQSAKQHLCARVLSLQGELESGPSGCAACTVWAVRTEDLDTDCVAPWATDAGFRGPTHMGLGPVPEGVAGVGPHPDESDGWYLSWDAETVEPHGVAHDEALDLSPATAATRGDTAWVLTPAEAWRLGE
jgi:hypothetical protein